MSAPTSLLRVVTCGSVDDGKSTLMGRLLLDAGLLARDERQRLEADSRAAGWPPGEVDCSLLFDGLADERAQGITIDVAYRYFRTATRRFIVADAPGHEQYTRNMVTAASMADVAIVLVDARLGLLAQTRRHGRLLALMGLRRVIVAVNKMDLVQHAQAAFEPIAGEARRLFAGLGIEHVAVVPVCARQGDNVVHASARMPWYPDPPLLAQLERPPPAAADDASPALRVPVQWIAKPAGSPRGYAGTVVAGRVNVGDLVRIEPSGRTSRIVALSNSGRPGESAARDDAVMLTLADHLDVARGDVVCAADDVVPVADRFEVTLAWIGGEPLLPGRDYLMKLGTASATATVAPLKHRVDIDSGAQVAAATLEANDIGVAVLELDRRLAFEPYARNRHLGGFILVDRLSNATVAAGMIHFALRRAANVRWQALTVDKAARRRAAGHGSAVVWFTGLSGAGKSTLANALEQRLHALGVRTYLLDGDNLRHGLSKDLGFTPADRVENIRRAAEVARLMVDAGLIVLAAFISPFRAERLMARGLVADGEFIEVHVDASLAVAEQRDPKGLYAKARRGELKNFTGIDSPYEPPEAPELHVDTGAMSVETATDRLIDLLRARGLLGGR